MLKSLFQKNYIFYGGSIVISRGLEYFVLFFAAHYMTKDDYGQLEYYKKIVEVGSTVLAFGFPALILSYTKSKDSKIYFYLLSIVFVLGLMGVLSIAGFYHPILFLLIVSMGFYALFFTGGIAQSYQIVHLGSNYASLYKIIISILFYGAVFCLIYFQQIRGEAYLYPSLILLPLVLVFTLFDFRKSKAEILKLKKYWNLFRKLLFSSFTLVVSNFANLLFLYTDIFIIKILSKIPNDEIADFSFALNVAGILLIISMTLIQVEIEKLKKNFRFIFNLNKKILTLTVFTSAILIFGYYILINTIYTSFNETFILFLIILIGKVFLTLSNLYGTNLIILKKFKLNLNINLIFLSLNIASCYFGYKLFGLIGIALSSALMLALRYVVLVFFNNFFIKKMS